MAISKTTNTDKTWNFLIDQGFTKAGTAGLMGNMHAESGVIPNRVEILCLKRLKENGQNYTDASYTAAVDSGKITRAKFLNPLSNKQYGYGLCQWTSPGRKGKLYDYIKSQNKSIGDLEGQLTFLIKELKESYSGVYKVLTSSNSVQEASDKVLKDFEIPNNWKSHSATRAGYSWEYYNLYKDAAAPSKSDKAPDQSKSQGTPAKTLVDWSKYAGKISNSGHDERNGARGGKAGDQGGEWEIRSWYNRPWDCVLRYPDQNVREWIALLGIEAANNNNIGYDQNERYSYWNQLQKVGYRPSKITAPCEADCSAGVIANVKAVGYLKNISALKNIGATYTGNMRSSFKNAGFQVLTDSKYRSGTEYLMPGDILLNDVHHTATNLGIGKKINYTPSADEPGQVPVTPTPPTVDYADSLDKALAGEYKVKADDGLNLRTGPNKTIITNIPNGKTVINYGYYTDTKDGRWLLVMYGSEKGFVSAKYVQKIESKKETIIDVPINTSGKLNTTKKFSGKVNTDALQVRVWAGKQYAPLKSIPVIYKGKQVDICDAVKANDGSKWYYIKINNSIYGFASSKYIK